MAYLAYLWFIEVVEDMSKRISIVCSARVFSMILFFVCLPWIIESFGAWLVSYWWLMWPWAIRSLRVSGHLRPSSCVLNVYVYVCVCSFGIQTYQHIEKAGPVLAMSHEPGAEYNAKN